jgi:bacteriorhodopsin
MSVIATYVIESFSQFEYELLYNMFSLTLAGMAAAFVFFIGARSQVDERYRGSLLVSALVVGVAAYHYFRIFEGFGAAVSVADGYAYDPAKFNEAYRYADWLVTVPLLMVELVAVLDLSDDERSSFLAKLTIATVAMLALGYPGEIGAAPGRAIWGFLSSIPFAYILYVLWVELGDVIEQEPGEAQTLLGNLRLLLLATWGFYPIVYMIPLFMAEPGSGAFVGVNVGYCIADLTAKAGYGIMIYHVARSKSENVATHGSAEAAAAE